MELKLVDRAAETRKPHGKVNPRKVTRAARALNRQTLAAVGVGAVAVTLTGLSLSHLAHGIEIVSGTADWRQSWSMATGIDLGFIALEVSQVTIAERLRKSLTKFARPAIFGTLAGSAAMNAFAFAESIDPTTLPGQIKLGSAILLGVAIPALIYSLTRVGAGLYIDAHNRKV